MAFNNNDNSKRKIRTINNDNNIHSFEAFSNKYQNKTKSEENLHFFANKKNKKLSIKNDSNKYYLTNENNSGYKFTTLNDKNKNGVFDLKNENSVNEKNNNDENDNKNKNNIHEEINNIYV